MIDKIIDNLFDLAADLWDKKRKNKEEKAKTCKQFWNDHREDIKRQQAEYKALPFFTKFKMFWKDFAKKLGLLIVAIVAGWMVVITLHQFGVLGEVEYVLSLDWLFK